MQSDTKSNDLPSDLPLEGFSLMKYTKFVSQILNLFSQYIIFYVITLVKEKVYLVDFFFFSLNVWELWDCKQSA